MRSALSAELVIVSPTPDELEIVVAANEVAPVTVKLPSVTAPVPSVELSVTAPVNVVAPVIVSVELNPTAPTKVVAPVTVSVEPRLTAPESVVVPLIALLLVLSAWPAAVSSRSSATPSAWAQPAP